MSFYQDKKSAQVNLQIRKRKFNPIAFGDDYAQVAVLYHQCLLECVAFVREQRELVQSKQ